MVLTDELLAIARPAFEKLAAEFPLTRPLGRRYWDIAGEIQYLANAGLPEAERFMATIDLSKAPESFGQASGAERVLTGPRSTSFKGSRRALNADPDSSNKSYVGRRGPHEPLDDV